jgi:putative addiction module component (TIGR02574 family)
MSVEQILREALALSAQEKAQVAETLLASLRSPQQREIDSAWEREIERRIDSYEAGVETARPAADVIAEIRQQLAQPKP